MYIFIVKAVTWQLIQSTYDHGFLFFVLCIYTRFLEIVGKFQEKRWDTIGKLEGKGQSSAWNKVEK